LFRMRRENYRSWRQKFCSDGCQCLQNNKDSTNFMRNIIISCAKTIILSSSIPKANQNHLS
jgi:hypothetical protein